MERGHTSPGTVDSDSGNKRKRRLCSGGSSSRQRREHGGNLPASTGRDVKPTQSQPAWLQRRMKGLFIMFKLLFGFTSTPGPVEASPGGRALGSGLGHDAADSRDCAGRVGGLRGDQDQHSEPGRGRDGQLPGTPNRHDSLHVSASECSGWSCVWKGQDALTESLLDRREIWNVCGGSGWLRSPRDRNTWTNTCRAWLAKQVTFTDVHTWNYTLFCFVFIRRLGEMVVKWLADAV